MKNIIYSLFVLGLCYACSDTISNGPEINFEISIEDTVKEDIEVPIFVSAQGIDASLTEAQILIDNEVYFDTIFPAQKSISFLWKTTFFDNPDLHQIKIQTKDTEGLISSKTQDIFVQKLSPPSITFDTLYVHTDTITSQYHNLNFSIQCKKGERSLDSLYIIHNKTVLYTFPNVIYTTMNDSLQVVPFTFVADSIGEFIIEFKLIDVSKKTLVLNKEIIVIQ